MAGADAQQKREQRGGSRSQNMDPSVVAAQRRGRRQEGSDGASSRRSREGRRTAFEEQ